MPGTGRSRPALRLAAAALVALTLGLAQPVAERGLLAAAPRASAQTPVILMVSRGRVLEEVAAARLLSAAEVAATESLQAEIDAVKAELNAEEEELTRLRSTLAREVFDARVAAFDLRVREERRRAQSAAAVLQRAYRDARRQLVEALGPILEEVRAERGAVAILDAESVLVADPGMDVTARVIDLFDRRVSAPVVVMPDEPGRHDTGAEQIAPPRIAPLTRSDAPSDGTGASDGGASGPPLPGASEDPDAGDTGRPGPGSPAAD